MSEPFRLAIVGTGQIAAQAHLPAALASHEVAVTALVDSVPGRARSLARDYGLDAIVAADVEDVFPQVDGVILATPNHTHKDLAVTCLDAGVGVLIEKPMTTTVAAAEEIVRAEEKSKGVVAVGYSTRFQDNNRFFKDLLDAGYFGRVRRWAYQFGSRGGWDPVSAYHLDRKMSGGGVLVVTGSHFIDRMLHWFGYPETFEFKDDADGGPEANCIAHIRHGSCEGTVRLSKTCALKQGFVMDAERGLVVLGEGEQAPVLLRPHEAPGVELEVRSRGAVPSPKQPFQRQIEDFVEACRGHSAPEVSTRDGLASTKLMEELYGCRVPLDLDAYPAEKAAVR